MISLATIRDMIKRLPGAEEGTSYGTPAFRVKKKLFARLHGKEDAIVLFLDSIGEQETLIRKDPMVFYITPHYEGYPAISVRPVVEDDEFFELLERAWRRVARKSDIADFERLQQS